MVADFAWPEPDPPPFTTIAWRLAHVAIGIFAVRCAWPCAGPAIDCRSATYPASAEGALGLLAETCSGWVEGGCGLDDEALWVPGGDGQPFLASQPMAAVALHANREAIHHLAEVLLLRDLWRHRHPLGARAVDISHHG